MVSDSGFDCVRVSVGDFYGGGYFVGGGCSRVAVAVALIFHIGGILFIAGLNAPKSKTNT